jgi:hypothetical protein
VTTDEQWAEYTRTIVQIALAGGTSIEIHPAEEGEVGRWPPGFVAPVLIFTAWDPGDARPGETTNRMRQHSLESELRTLGATIWFTVGRDPLSDHREEGVAVIGLSEETVLDMARRYGQSAIFVLTPDAWTTVSCVDGSRRAIGWRSVELEKEPGQTGSSASSP